MSDDVTDSDEDTDESGSDGDGQGEGQKGPPETSFRSDRAGRRMR